MQGSLTDKTPASLQPDVHASALENRWIALPGWRIHFRANTSAKNLPTVVLVHGLIVASTYMMPTAEGLAPFCRVLAPDLPGYGQSFKPWPILDMAGLADALAAWMDALEIAQAHLVGNSFGCQVIAEFAARYPHRVARLVLQGPTMDAAARSILKQIWRSILNSPNEPPSLGRISLQDYRAAGIRRVCETYRLAFRDRIEEKLPHIQAPTLVVRGGKDPIVPQRWAEEVTRLLPSGTLRVIPGVGHTINYSAPRRFVELIRPFLEI